MNYCQLHWLEKLKLSLLFPFQNFANVASEIIEKYLRRPNISFIILSLFYKIIVWWFIYIWKMVLLYQLNQLNQLEIILSVKMGNHGPKMLLLIMKIMSTQMMVIMMMRKRERYLLRERESSIKNLNENQKVYKLL